MNSKADFIILPGIGGSGDDHRQTRWEKADNRMKRFSPADWNHPDLEDWIAAMDHAIAKAKSPPFLVAHSLACLLVPHWQAAGERAVSGAFLVAVPYAASDAFPDEAAQFAAFRTEPLRFPALMLASTDDPYASLGFARRQATVWGCPLEMLGPLGHVNSASGVGDWPEGRQRLHRFVQAAGTGV